MSIAIDPRAKALIFGLDGILVDSVDAHVLAWRETLLAHDVDLSDAEFAELRGRTSGEVVAAINQRRGLELDPDAITLQKNAAFVRHVPLLQTRESIRALVEASAGTLPCGVATNEHLGVANIVMRATGLASLFNAMVTSDEVDAPKPAPDLFLECAARLGVDPADCQAFEDSDGGIAAARAAGMIATDVRGAI